MTPATTTAVKDELEFIEGTGWVRNDLDDSAAYQAICKWLRSYSKGDADFSVTELLDPPRIKRLRRQHEQQIVLLASSFTNAFLGAGLHRLMEGAPSPKRIKETRFVSEIAGYKIGGQIDDYDVTSCRLADYKVMSVWEVIFGGLRKSKEQQLNCYAWLLEKHGLPVKSLRVQAFYRDFSLPAFLRGEYGEHISANAEPFDIPLWPFEERERFLRERMTIHLKDRELPEPLECTVEERWSQPDKFAVMKTGGKRAIKVCDTRDEAQRYIDCNPQANKLHVERRPAKRHRCLNNYCHVNEWCSQWQAEKK